jgi:serine/threonine-protein kinase
MLNFIITKALAKELDDRYPNAKEFADDLRACRDALPRSSAKVETTKPQPAPSTQIPGAIPIATQTEAGTEESKSVAHMGLSSNFDSFEATMRLAAMTAPEDVEEIGKTLRMTRPSMDAINQAAPVPATPKVTTSAATTRTIPLPARQGQSAGAGADAPPPSSNRNLLLFMIILLVLLGLAFFL